MLLPPPCAAAVVAAAAATTAAGHTFRASTCASYYITTCQPDFHL